MKTSPIFAAVVLLVVGACATARKVEPLAPPLDVSNPKLARGQKMFFQHCHECHPHGQGGLGPAIVNKPLPEFLMKFQVRHGLGAMPSFGPDKIPKEDLDALMSYVEAIMRNPSSVGAK
jgi:mono/diheme cytochrome c family protein